MNIPLFASSLRSASSLIRREGVKDFSKHPLLRARCKTTVASESAAVKPAEKAVETKTVEAVVKDAPKKAAKEAAASKPAAESAESVPIGATLAAMSLAIATVSTVAAIAETSTAGSCPKFDPQSQRFDQSTFGGRLSKMLLACDPYLLTCSHDEVMRCKELVENYEKVYADREGGVSEVEINRKLWEAQVRSLVSQWIHMMLRLC